MQVDHIFSEGWVNKELYVKAFYLGNKICFNTEEMVDVIESICQHLKQGDYSDLTRISEYYN